LNLFVSLSKGSSAIPAKPGSFRVLGIDPGLATTGYGVIEKKGMNMTALTHGVIRTAGADAHDLPKRLVVIYDAISLLIDTYRPDQVAMEHLFFSKNRTSGIFVSEARGVIALAIAQGRVPLYEYTPNQVKQAVTGSGKADKKQVQTMIQRILGLPEPPRPDDAADGLSLALCHLNTMRCMR
jgi:crossover junction endodeoxyribonuclease RuvC